MPGTSEMRPFSTTWMVLSVLLFTAAEVVVGTVVGPLVVGKYVSPMLHLRVMMLLHLGSFFLGGVAVGLLSPGVRLIEPALGAALAVALVFMLGFFMPGPFLGFSG